MRRKRQCAPTLALASAAAAGAGVVLPTPVAALASSPGFVETLAAAPAITELRDPSFVLDADSNLFELSDGALIYRGAAPARFDVRGHATVAIADGGAATLLAFFIAVDGVFVEQGGGVTPVPEADGRFIAADALVTLAPGQRVALSAGTIGGPRDMSFGRASLVVKLA